MALGTLCCNAASDACMCVYDHQKIRKAFVEASTCTCNWTLHDVENLFRDYFYDCYENCFPFNMFSQPCSRLIPNTTGPRRKLSFTQAEIKPAIPNARSPKPWEISEGSFPSRLQQCPVEYSTVKSENRSSSPTVVLTNKGNFNGSRSSFQVVFDNEEGERLVNSRSKSPAVLFTNQDSVDGSRPGSPVAFRDDQVVNSRSRSPEFVRMSEGSLKGGQMSSPVIFGTGGGGPVIDSNRTIDSTNRLSQPLLDLGFKSIDVRYSSNNVLNEERKDEGLSFTCENTDRCYENSDSSKKIYLTYKYTFFYRCNLLFVGLISDLDGSRDTPLISGRNSFINLGCDGDKSASVADVKDDLASLPSSIPAGPLSSMRTRVPPETDFMSLFEHNANLHHERPWVNIPKNILYCGFSRSRNGCTIGSNNLFRIMQATPFYIPEMKKMSKDLYTAVSWMLGKCEIIALVGAGKNPDFPTNHVYVWDVVRKKMAEIACDSLISNIEIRLGRWVNLMLSNTIYY